jgi:hypothetical protein
MQKWKKISNVKYGIFQQPLVQYSPNLKLKLPWPNKTEVLEIKTTSN